MQFLLLKRAYAAKRPKTHMQPAQEVMVAQATDRVLSVKERERPRPPGPDEYIFRLYIVTKKSIFRFVYRTPILTQFRTE